MSEPVGISDFTATRYGRLLYIARLNLATGRGWNRVGCFVLACECFRASDHFHTLANVARPDGRNLLDDAMALDRTLVRCPHA